MGRCLAMGWASAINGAGWGRGAVQGEVHEGLNRKLVDQSGSVNQTCTCICAYVCSFMEARTYIHSMFPNGGLGLYFIPVILAWPRIEPCFY